MSPHLATFRKCRIVRFASGMHTKAEGRRSARRRYCRPPTESVNKPIAHNERQPIPTGPHRGRNPNTSNNHWNRSNGQPCYSATRTGPIGLSTLRMTRGVNCANRIFSGTGFAHIGLVLGRLVLGRLVQMGSLRFARVGPFFEDFGPAASLPAHYGRA